MTSTPPTVELDDLGIDSGAHILVKLALAERATGDEIALRGRHADLLGGLAAWCRQHGHHIRTPEHPDAHEVVAWVRRGRASTDRWMGAQPSAPPDVDGAPAIAARPSPDWGLSARGAMVEAGGPTPEFHLDRREVVWSDLASQLHRQALAEQWDPSRAIDWTPPDSHPEIEAAVIQVMTFLIENEEVALVVPARFLGQVHPHFREVQQVLAVTVADEARHIEVFSRRVEMSGQPLALSTVSGRVSLQTLLDEPDFAIASFLLSVMGEGTFVALLTFLERHAPDPLTRRIAHLVRADDSRHVAFGMGHLTEHARVEPDLRSRLARAVERRHRELQSSAGLNEEVFDALVLLAVGTTRPADVATGWAAVQDLKREMDDSRRGRLARLGFTLGEAEELSSLHARNFM